MQLQAQPHMQFDYIVLPAAGDVWYKKLPKVLKWSAIYAAAFGKFEFSKFRESVNFHQNLLLLEYSWISVFVVIYRLCYNLGFPTFGLSLFRNLLGISIYFDVFVLLVIQLFLHQLATRLIKMLVLQVLFYTTLSTCSGCFRSVNIWGFKFIQYKCFRHIICFLNRYVICMEYLPAFAEQIGFRCTSFHESGLD